MSGLLGLVGGGVLFAEDFDRLDRGPAQEELEVIEPVFDRAQMETVKAASFEEGVAAGRAAMLAEDTAGLRQAVAVLGEELGAVRDSARLIGEQAAVEIARLMLSALGAVMPVLCEAHGDGEVQAIARAVLPALAGEPEIVIRANPHTVSSLAVEIARMDPDIGSRVQITPTDALRPGDVRIAWRNGLAVREGAALWRDVAAILLPQGLLGDDAAAGRLIIEEAADGE